MTENKYKIVSVDPAQQPLCDAAMLLANQSSVECEVGHGICFWIERFLCNISIDYRLDKIPTRKVGVVFGPDVATTAAARQISADVGAVFKKYPEESLEDINGRLRHIWLTDTYADECPAYHAEARARLGTNYKLVEVNE